MSEANQTQKVEIRGANIALTSREVFWKSDDGTIELNRFTGNVSAKIPKDISDRTEYAVNNGIMYGRIEIVDKVFTEEPFLPESAISVKSNATIQARRMLDEIDVSVFEEMVAKTSNPKVLDAALAIEKEDQNRKPYIACIKARINELGA